MSRQAKRSKAEVATIDCNLITIETAYGEFGFDTSNKLEIKPQTEEEDAVKLVVKGVLRAQKPKTVTVTGHELTLTDNVFNPDLVKAIQGGEIVYDEDGDLVSYTPPVSGVVNKLDVFALNAYSAQYDASGAIIRYEKISYPNCQGVPVAFSSEDGTFRAPEYTITSAPKKGESPYKLSYVNSLPILVDEYALGVLSIASVTGATIGTTYITVSPKKDEYSNVYLYKIFETDVDAILPAYGTSILTTDGWIVWDGDTDITATTGKVIVMIEAESNYKALSGGKIEITSKE